MPRRNESFCIYSQMAQGYTVFLRSRLMNFSDHLEYMLDSFAHCHHPSRKGIGYWT